MRRILVAGQTGLKRQAVLEALKAEIDRHSDQYRNRVHIYPLETYIKRFSGLDPARFPVKKSTAEMREAWVKGWNHLTRAIAGQDPQGCSLVSAHLVYYQHGRPVTPLRFDLLAAWQPDTIITLIDDLFAVRNRISMQDYYFTLSELYVWRMAEWLMADQVAWVVGADGTPSPAEAKPIPNFLVSVKHPVQMLFRLLFRPEIPRVYASFPISSTRDEERDGSYFMREEINRFRSHLHRKFTVFDPLTIDERIMQKWMRSARSDMIRFQFGEGPGQGPPDRWDCRVNGEDDGNYSPLLWDAGLGRAEIPVAEIQQLLERIKLAGESEVDDQITWRDYRLVEQADYVVCHRPFYLNRHHGGVDAEISYANDRGRVVHAFVSTDEKPAQTLKGRIDHTYTDEKAFRTALNNLRPDDDLRLGRTMF